ncbi:DNA repair protein RecN [Fredinandcohnia sp. QZ13]|uniref:DNA repair protein RecN n=1 Tax=Fredinandcohnia sp. QZ13 TaxID=3073144 RepID=UPI0028537284|nr:DNA repair protein RecN [Fredinandcohnia sp. QZ13]MDR4888867.1 DNA repair protein RecN [Fredinandcohnia sp. QZ13]
MLAELSIKNFAIIESLSISLEKGLTVLTGETGAGKSIIIDAIHLLVGGRGSVEFVRYGEERAEIEGLFLIEDDNHPCYTKAMEFGIEISEGMVVLRRDISKSGKSVCRINGKLVTISILREFGRTLIDIHGQHEHQDLMNQEQHIYMLDQYGGDTLKQALQEYLAVYKDFLNVKQRLKSFNENEQELAHRLDLIQFQLNEIGKANLKPNEDVVLTEERNKISNYEKIFKSLQNSYNALYGDQKGLDWVGLAMNQAEAVMDIDKELKSIHETISNSFYLLEEISYKIRDQLDKLEFDPARLDFIEGRLNEIAQLKRKYGQSVEEILEYAAKIEDEIDTIQNREQHIGKLKEELESILEDVKLESENVSQIRKKLAKELIGKITQELKDLYMEKAKFDIKFFEDTPIKFTLNGKDDIEFYISTNPGEPLKPLAKIASGGELSRIMLAIKSIFSKHQGVTSIIFDEVDTGVSGRVAQAIAEKIYGISVNSQVLCISHLPQVAAMSDTHLFITKETIQGRTTTSVTSLDETEKIKEISRMISGVEITDLTKEHAKELLSLAKESKLTRQMVNH